MSAGAAEGSRPVRVTSVVAEDRRSAVVTISGDVDTPTGPQRLLFQLRQVRRGLPSVVRDLVLDLGSLDAVTIDVAAILRLEQRLAHAGQRRLAAVLGAATSVTTPAADRLLRPLLRTPEPPAPTDTAPASDPPEGAQS